MLDERTNLAQQVIAELKKFFGRSCAPRLSAEHSLAEAAEPWKPALVYDPGSKGAESYIRLAKECWGAYGGGRFGRRRALELY